MTREEKDKAIENYCKGRACNGCPLYEVVRRDVACFGVGADTERNYALLFPNDTEPTTNDVVNRPKHYCREGAMECIDEMILLFGKETVKHFCLCNAWKYRYRAAEKNGEEDLKKSDWYIRKYRELCGGQP